MGRSLYRPRLVLVPLFLLFCNQGWAVRELSAVYWARGGGSMQASLIITNVCGVNQTVTAKFRSETGHGLAHLPGSPLDAVLSCSTSGPWDICTVTVSGVAPMALMRVQATSLAGDTPVVVSVSVAEDRGCVIANLKLDPTSGPSFQEFHDLNAGRPF